MIISHTEWDQKPAISNWMFMINAPHAKVVVGSVSRIAARNRALMNAKVNQPPQKYNKKQPPDGIISHKEVRMLWESLTPTQKVDSKILTGSILLESNEIISFPLNY